MFFCFFIKNNIQDNIDVKTSSIHDTKTGIFILYEALYIIGDIELHINIPIFVEAYNMAKLNDSYFPLKNLLTILLNIIRDVSPPNPNITLPTTINMYLKYMQLYVNKIYPTTESTITYLKQVYSPYFAAKNPIRPVKNIFGKLYAANNDMNYLFDKPYSVVSTV